MIPDIIISLFESLVKFIISYMVICDIAFYFDYRRWWWFINTFNSSDCGSTCNGTCFHPYHHPTGPTSPENVEDYEVCNILMVLSSALQF